MSTILPMPLKRNNNIIRMDKSNFTKFKTLEFIVKSNPFVPHSRFLATPRKGLIFIRTLLPMASDFVNNKAIPQILHAQITLNFYPYAQCFAALRIGGTE